jgi:hypothetical protein
VVWYHPSIARVVDRLARRIVAINHADNLAVLHNDVLLTHDFTPFAIASIAPSTAAPRWAVTDSGKRRTIQATCKLDDDTA